MYAPIRGLLTINS